MKTVRERRGRTYLWWVAAMIAVSLVTAACASDDDDTGTSLAQSGTTDAGDRAATTETETTASDTAATGTPTSASDLAATATPTSDIDPAGVLQFGQRLVTGVGIHFDPTQLQAEAPNINWLELIYGTLMRQAEDATLQPWMAQDVEIVDPQTVRITLRPDITFTDGSAYDAEAVKTSLLRQRFEPATAAVGSSIHPGLNALASVDVIDPTTVVANLDQPIASVFVESLASLAGIVQSPKQLAENPAEIDTNPVGAGPYTLERYVSEERIELRKNPDFWDAASWTLGGVNFVQTPNGAPQINALLADTIDFNLEVPIDSLKALEADSDLTTEVMPIRYTPLLLCAGKPPFDNEAVRHAVQIGIDRDEYNELVYGGLGEPAHGALPADHPSFDPALEEQLAYDPDQATQLLADAGAVNPSFDLVVISTLNMDRHAEVLQAQLERIGVTVNIVRSDNVYADWIEPQAPGALLAPLTGQPVGGYIFFAKQFVKGGPNAFCGVEDPALMEHVNQAAQLEPDDPQAIDAYRQANQAFVDNAFTIPLVFEPIAATWNTSRIGGTPTFIDTGGTPRPRFDSIHITN